MSASHRPSSLASVVLIAGSLASATAGLAAWEADPAARPIPDAAPRAPRANASPAAGGLWTTDGVPVCRAAGEQAEPALVPDGAGGSFVAWADRRDGASWDIYLQRLDASGNALWAPDGLPVCRAPGNQRSPRLVGDGTGGVFAVWADSRSAANLAYAIRLLADGSVAPGWAPDGNPVLAPPVAVPLSVIDVATDGSGGIFVLNGASVTRVQRLGGDGAPATGWAPEGVVVLADEHGADYSSRFRHPRICRGLPGEVWLSWHHQQSWSDRFGYLYETFAGGLRLLGANGAIKVDVGGFGAASYFGGSPVPIRPDGAGGVIYQRDASELLFRRVSPQGATTWESGLFGFSTDIVAAADGSGGMLFAWAEYSESVRPLRAWRLGPDGAPDPAWPAGGRMLSDPAAVSSWMSLTQLVPGRFACVWVDAHAGNANIYATELSTSDGLPQYWPSGGIVVCGEPHEQHSVTVATTNPGVISLAWKDMRDDPGDIYAQAIASDAPVPVSISNVKAEVIAGIAHLGWYATQAAGRAARVERSSGHDTWADIGGGSFGADGWLRFEDPDVEPGETYGYRLRLDDGSGGEIAGGTWLDVPMPWRLSIGGVTATAGDDLRLVIELPSSAPATLEVFDVTGRRVHAQPVGDSSAGRHDVVLRSSVAGIRWLRLRQAGQQAVRRIVSLR